MSHDALAELFTLVAAIGMAVVGLLYRDFRARLRVLENNQKMVIVTLYHLALGAPLPEHIKEEIERRVINGKVR